MDRSHSSGSEALVYASTLPCVQADTEQLQGVFLNLLLNAVQARMIVESQEGEGTRFTILLPPVEPIRSDLRECDAKSSHRG